MFTSRADGATSPKTRTPRSRKPRPRGLPWRARIRRYRRGFGIAIGQTRTALGANLASILVVQGLSLWAVVPAMGWLFEHALRHAGIPNVSDRTLGVLLADPTATVLLAVIVLLMFGAVWLQLASIVAIAARGQSGRPMTLRGVLGDTARAFRRVWNVQLPVLLLYLLAVVPLSGLGAFSTVTQGVAVPPFVTREFMKSPLSAALYVAIFAVLLYVNARLILTVPAMLVGRLRPLAAMRASLRMTRRGSLDVALVLAAPAAAGILLSAGLGRLIAGWVGPGDGTGGLGLAIAVGCGKALGFLVVAAAMTVAMNVAVAATRLELGDDAGLAPASPAARPDRRERLRNGAVAAAALGAAFAMGAVSTPAALAAPVPTAANTVILSHRGDVWGGVENTIGALEAAATEHPDYVEADFQQTADGVFVASHDTNLLMTAGIDRNIFDMTAEEATHTVVSQHGYSDTIPTMAEYVVRARELGVTLLIELKVTGHERPGFVQDFLDELDAIGATDHEIYHSLDPAAVVELKRLRPELRVGLTIAMSAGGVPDSPCDFFVIEQASFTDDFLAEAHRQGKQVYVWTVNGDVRIRDFLRMPVDGIVTDYTTRAIAFRAELSGHPAPELAVEDALSPGKLLP